MKKVIIEIKRNENFPFGYGDLKPITADSPEVIDKIVEWSQNNPDFVVYRHYVRCDYEKVGELGQYDFAKEKGWSEGYRPGVDRCHQVYYLIIYFQDHV